MATRTSRSWGEGKRELSILPDDELRRISSLTKYELIQEIAALSARAEISDELSLFCALRYWWSKEYNRPYKDPLLETYTIEELAMEYYDKIERHKAEAERLSENSDKIESSKIQDALDWAEQEEARELLEIQQEKAAEPDSDEHVPSPEEEEWMKKQMEAHLQKMKEEYGDDFGEDIISGDE